MTHQADCEPPFGWLKWRLPIISLAELSAPITHQPPCLTEWKRGVAHTQENPYPFLNFPLPSQFNSQRILPCLSASEASYPGSLKGALEVPGLKCFSVVAFFLGRSFGTFSDGVEDLDTGSRSQRGRSLSLQVPNLQPNLPVRPAEMSAPSAAAPSSHPLLGSFWSYPPLIHFKTLTPVRQMSQHCNAPPFRNPSEVGSE